MSVSLVDAFSPADVEQWLKQNNFDEAFLLEFAKYDGRAMLGLEKSALLEAAHEADLNLSEVRRLQALLNRQAKVAIGTERRSSMNASQSVYSFSVFTSKGVEISGNCFALGTLRVATAYHNGYDADIPLDGDLFPDDDKYCIYKVAEDDPTQCIRVFRYGLASRNVKKSIVEGEESLAFETPLLLKFVDGSHSADWAVYELVSGYKEWQGVTVVEDPGPLHALLICPEAELPQTVAGVDQLKAYHYDLHFFNESVDTEEELTCQKVAYGNVTLYKPKSNLIRVVGGLNRGSCGCPYVDTEGRVVALHLASLDATADRQSKTRYRLALGPEARESYRKRKALTVKAFAEHNEYMDNPAKKTSVRDLTAQVQAVKQNQLLLHEEQGVLYHETSDLADNFTHYKEGLVIVRDPALIAAVNKFTVSEA